MWDVVQHKHHKPDVEVSMGVGNVPFLICFYLHTRSVVFLVRRRFESH